MEYIMNTSALSLSRSLSSGRGGSLLARIATMVKVARERRMLADLDSHALKDLGLTEKDVAREMARPFWDVPAGR